MLIVNGDLWPLLTRKNFVFLQIGYKTLSYELQEQTVGFGIEALFGMSYY